MPHRLKGMDAPGSIKIFGLIYVFCFLLFLPSLMHLRVMF